MQSFALDDGIKIKLYLDNFILKYYKNDSLLFADRAPLAYNFENEFGKETCHYITRMQGERIFGLGDKGGKLNKAGRAFRIETTDCMGYDARESDPLYKHIPFYICENSVGCYGIFYDTSDTSYMDLGKEINNYYPPYKYFKTQDNCLVYYVFSVQSYPFYSSLQACAASRHSLRNGVLIIVQAQWLIQMPLIHSSK